MINPTDCVKVIFKNLISRLKNLRKIKLQDIKQEMKIPVNII